MGQEQVQRWTSPVEATGKPPPPPHSQGWRQDRRLQWLCANAQGNGQKEPPITRHPPLGGNPRKFWGQQDRYFLCLGAPTQGCGKQESYSHAIPPREGPLAKFGPPHGNSIPPMGEPLIRRGWDSSTPPLLIDGSRREPPPHLHGGGTTVGLHLSPLPKNSPPPPPPHHHRTGQGQRDTSPTPSP